VNKNERLELTNFLY